MSSTATTPPAGNEIDATLDEAYPLPSIRRVVATALLTLVVACGGLTIWAFATPIERAVIAGGSLISEGRRKSISLVDAGVLRQMMVKDGDVVRAGQVLVRMDPTGAEANAAQARAQYLGGMARIARLKAEQSDHRSFAVPAEIESQVDSTPTLRELIDTERRLFRARWEAFDGQVAVQELVISQMSAQVAGIPRQRAAVEQQLAAIQERIRGFADLARTGVGSRFRVLELTEPEQGYRAAIVNLTTQESQLRQGIAGAQAQLAAIRLNRQQDIANDMQTAAANVAQSQESLRAAQEVLARRDVVAPEDGVVTNIQLYTPGSSVLPGQTLMELVPQHDRLIVEAKVSPIDVEQVSVGQSASVRLMPYRQRQTPLVGARVIHLGADQQVDNSGNTYFVARLSLTQAELDAIPNLRINAGMPVEAYILGEPRTVAYYIVGPLIDATRRTLRD